MYQFISGNEVIGYCQQPDYIKVLDNGCYGLCSEEEAQGVAINSVPYQLTGNYIEGLPEVSINYIPDTDFFKTVLLFEQALNVLGVETEEANEN